MTSITPLLNVTEIDVTQREHNLLFCANTILYMFISFLTKIGCKLVLQKFPKWMLITN